MSPRPEKQHSDSLRFEKLRSHMVPMPVDNVDTDQIIPARFLKVTDKRGLGDKLFHDWRYHGDGADNSDFVLNHEASQGAQILLAGSNFGSGSSREHAPWALVGWGLRAILAPSFADIFGNNALKNGLLPVALPADVHEQLMQAVHRDRGLTVEIDLERQVVTLPDQPPFEGQQVSFDIDPFAKHCLLGGIDQLGYLQSFEQHIAAHEERRGV